MKNRTRPAQANQSIELGFTCLLELMAEEAPLNCSQIARKLGINRTKASRIMGTLAHLGMVERLPDMRYVPGAGIHLLSAMGLHSSGLLNHCFPYIQTMKEKHGMDAALGVMWRDQVSYLYHSARGRELTDAIGGHRLFPAHKSSIGRVLLAEYDDESIRERFGDNLNNSEYSKLFTSLRKIRKAGNFAEEHSIAVAVGSPVIAGLTFMCPAEDTITEAIIKEVSSIAENISESISNEYK